MGNDWDDFKSGYNSGSGIGGCLGAIVLSLFSGAFSILTAMFVGILNMNQTPVEDKLRYKKNLPTSSTLTSDVICSCGCTNETGRVFCITCGKPLFTFDVIKLGDGVAPIVIAFAVWVAFMVAGLFISGTDNGLGRLIGYIWVLVFLGIGARILITRFL